MTDVPSDARVAYTADGQESTQFFSQLSLDHAVTLLNLTPGKSYTYRVIATNSKGLSTESNSCGGSTCSFQTLVSKYW